VTIREEITVPATHEGIITVLDMLDDLLARVEIPEMTASEVHLAVEEAVVNIVSYGQGKSMTLMLCIDESSVGIDILDDGIPFNPLLVSAPDLEKPLDDRVPGGLGIYLIRRSMSTVSYHYRDGKNILRLVKRLRPVEIFHMNNGKMRPVSGDINLGYQTVLWVFLQDC
jgi:serine/threonine-protein kinase RsbW